MKRLSIIVPIYNVESYLEKCLRSLEDQDIRMDDFEIICINDGSLDDSRKVVINMHKEYNNIILIDQENQGVSRARNSGIDKASGKYLLFIDPDDFIDSKCFKRILKNADMSEAQVSFLGFTVLNEDGSKRNQVLNENLTSQIYVGTEAYFLARGDGDTDPDRMWAVLFKKEFLIQNNLRYLSNVPYLEDGELIARILCAAGRCIFDGYSFYQRTTRPGSATNSKLFYSEKATNGFLMAASNLKLFQQGQNLNEKQKEFLNQPIVKFAILAISSCLGWDCFSRIRSVKNKLKENGLNKCHLEGCRVPYVFYGKIYNYSKYLTAVVLFIWPRIKRLTK